MDAKAWGVEMARYNSWQNGTMFDLVNGLTEAEREGHRGLFFGSIRHTLDHIIMVDELLFRLADTGVSPTSFEPEKLIYPTYEALARSRSTFDTRLEARFDQVTSAWFDEAVSFTRPAVNHRTSLPRQFLMMQMFNHGTHHRSQVSAELHRMGIDYGNTDLPFNPHSTF
jgi:uncharacterized damage-inducible protein DinB